MITVLELARAIATELGEGWGGSPAYHAESAFIYGPGEQRIFIVRENWGASKGRVKASTCFPEEPKQLYPRPKCSEATFAPTRLPKAVARDLERKLLTDEYRAEIARVLDAREKYMGAFQKRQALAGQLLAQFPTLVDRGNDQGEGDVQRDMHTKHGSGPVSADLEIYCHADTGELTLRGPIADLVKALAAVVG